MPDNVKALSRLSVALYRMQRLYETVDSCHQVLKLQPEDMGTHCVLAMALLELGNGHEAIKYSEKAVQLNQNSISAHILNGSIQSSLGQYELALQSYQKATALSPNMLDAIAGEADALIKLGDSNQAYDMVLKYINDGKDNPALATVFAATTRVVGKEDHAIDVLEKNLNKAGINHVQRRQLHFAAGELYDRINQYDKAFYHYKAGNALMQRSYNAENDQQAFEKITQVFTKQELQRMSNARQIDITPIFIVGMPRSGTSLLEKILSCHAAIHPGGELPFLPEIVKSMPDQLNTNIPFPECIKLIDNTTVNRFSSEYFDKLRSMISNEKFVTDKLPHNYILLGLIEKLFPHARIIHCVRDPLDTCLSNYFQDFSSTINYTNDLDNIATHYMLYAKLMNHWKNTLTLPIFEFSYESLINNQKKATRDVLDYCGLDWDPECLSFYESKYITRTASNDQVKQPIHKKSIGRWRNYEKHLMPLTKKLHKYR